MLNMHTTTEEKPIGKKEKFFYKLDREYENILKFQVMDYF